MQKSTREVLLDEIDRFLELSGYTKTRFGREAVANDRIVDQLRARANPRTDTADDIRAFIRDWRPARANPKLRAQQPAA